MWHVAECRALVHYGSYPRGLLKEIRCRSNRKRELFSFFNLERIEKRIMTYSEQMHIVDDNQLFVCFLISRLQNVKESKKTSVFY